jgi:hypothetical protein
MSEKEFVIRRGITDNYPRQLILNENFLTFEANNLQDAYVKDWIDNTMLFLEVKDVNLFWNELLELELTTKYKDVKLVPIRVLD